LRSPGAFCGCIGRWYQARKIASQFWRVSSAEPLEPLRSSKGERPLRARLPGHARAPRSLTGKPRGGLPGGSRELGFHNQKPLGARGIEVEMPKALERIARFFARSVKNAPVMIRRK
jgi:hypothetical protein